MSLETEEGAGFQGGEDLTDEVIFNARWLLFRGTYSSVYKGTCRGQPVAIKVLNPVSNEGYTMRRKFRREVTLWSALDHPNIVPFYGFTESSQDFGPIGSLISPWYDNGDAAKLLRERGDSLYIEDRLDLWQGVILGVDYLHEQNIVHGDLKPGNVLIDDNGRARICDFGLAHLYLEEASTGMTTTSTHYGTERYLAPELLTEIRARPSKPSDVWALGCIGLEFLYSVAPYQHREDNRGGFLFQDIRSGVLPSSQPNDNDLRSLKIWNLLVRCWFLLPNERVDVRTIIQSLDHMDVGVVDLWREPTSVLDNKVLKGHTQTVRSVAFSPEGTHAISGSYDGTIKVWDVATMQAVGEPFKGHSDAICSVAFSPRGDRIASGSTDKTVRIWDINTRRTLKTCTGHTKLVSSVAFSPDGTRIASGSSDKTIKLWDATTGNALGNAYRGHRDLIESVAFSPDGARIASGSWDETIRVWDVAMGQVLGTPLTGSQGIVYSIAFSPDGTRIASASQDNNVRIWDVATGQVIGAAFTGHTNRVSSVVFSWDGTCIVSGSYDASVRIWDTVMGQVVGGALTGHIGPVTSVALSPNGSSIASGSEDNTVRLWTVPSMVS